MNAPKYITDRRSELPTNVLIQWIRRDLKTRMAILKQVTGQVKRMEQQRRDGVWIHSMEWNAALRYQWVARRNVRLTLAALNIVRCGGFFDKAIEADRSLVTEGQWPTGVNATGLIELFRTYGYRGYVLPYRMRDIFPSSTYPVKVTVYNGMARFMPDNEHYPLKGSDPRTVRRFASDDFGGWRRPEWAKVTDPYSGTTTESVGEKWGFVPSEMSLLDCFVYTPSQRCVYSGADDMFGLAIRNYPWHRRLFILGDGSRWRLYGADRKRAETYEFGRCYYLHDCVDNTLDIVVPVLPAEYNDCSSPEHYFDKMGLDTRRLASDGPRELYMANRDWIEQ